MDSNNMESLIQGYCCQLPQGGTFSLEVAGFVICVTKAADSYVASVETMLPASWLCHFFYQRPELAEDEHFLIHQGSVIYVLLQPELDLNVLLARIQRSYLSVLLLSPEIEERIRKGIRNTSTGSYLNLEPEDNEYILQAFDKQISEFQWSLENIVMLTAIDIRRYTKRLIENQYPELTVLSFGEISELVKVNVIKVLS